MIDHDAISLFEELVSRYPKAAAGLIDDLCSKLSAILEEESRDKSTVADASWFSFFDFAICRPLLYFWDGIFGKTPDPHP